jgi:thiamine pyrophosphate-dependent acetolactate synthase large subunit-like protein
VRTGEAIVALLHEHYGVDVVFGIPGVHNIELYRGLSSSGVRAISPRHEQGAGFMADGYALASGRPGVCMLITGPGLTNALTPMGQAYHDSRPMLVLAATTPTTDLGKGHGPLHDISDQAAIARPVTAFSETVMEPTEVPALLARAWDVFHLGRPRPVHLALPTDVLAEPTEAYLPIVTTTGPPTADAAAIDAAAELLRAAMRPMIVAGGGAIDAGESLRALAEQLGATVVLTGNAKGVLPSSHPLCAGNTLSNPTTQRLLAEADCVVVVGTEVSDADIWNGGRPLALALDGSVVRIDIDRAQLTRRMNPTIGIVADTAVALHALVTALDGHFPTVDGAAAASEIREAVVARANPQQLPWLQAIEAALPDDVFVALDSTQLAYTAHSYLPCEAPRRWLAPYGYGTLGCAIPMAIGAHIACPDRPAFALVGDGGWMFTIAEMATAVDVGADIVVVLWDNGGYGQIAVSFDDAQAPPLGVAISSPDPEGIARGFGWSTVGVDEPHELQGAITNAFAAGGPQFIHVRRPRLQP